MHQYFTGQICGPFHYEARQKAGFSAAKPSVLEHMEKTITRSKTQPYEFMAKTKIMAKE